MMNVKLLIRVCLFVVIITNVAMASGLQSLAPGVYWREGQAGEMFKQAGLANLGVVVGSRCVAVIDTGGSRSEGVALLTEIQNITNKPICYVINTHVHPDHALGNSAFRSPETNFIAHENYSRALGILGPVYVQRAKAEKVEKDVGTHWLVKPDEIVFDETTLELGDRSLLLTAVNKAHTDHDLLVLDETSGIMFGGDLLFNQHVPVIGGSGSILGWLNELPALKMHKITQWVPGHGEVMGNTGNAFLAQQMYLQALRDEVRQWIADDGDLALAVERIGQSLAKDWQQFNLFHKRNVSYTYRELEWE